MKRMKKRRERSAEPMEGEEGGRGRGGAIKRNDRRIPRGDSKAIDNGWHRATRQGKQGLLVSNK